MEDFSSQKLTGLSSEQISVYFLQKSVECANGFWNLVLHASSMQPLLCDPPNTPQAKCRVASSAFLSVIKSTELLKDSGGALQSFLSENVMKSYLRLALVFFGDEICKGANDTDEEMCNLSSDVKSVAAACLKCMDSGDNFDKLVSDFTEGAIYILSILTNAIEMNRNQNNCPLKENFIANFIRFATTYVGALSSMSRKHSNKKKLYTSFCTRLLEPCIEALHHCESTNLKSRQFCRTTSVLDDLTRVLEVLVENILFSEDKNVEDLATSGALFENFAIELMPSSANTSTSRKDFTASYHGTFFEALGVAVLKMSSVKGTNNFETQDNVCYSFGIAKLLKVYSTCSNRILLLSLVAEQSIDDRNIEGGNGGRQTSSLLERRKHAMRILQISLSMMAIIDTACQKQLLSGLLHSTGDDCANQLGLTGAVRCLVSCVETQKQLLQTLSTSLDETGGSSILATHDALQAIAKRLHLFSTRCLAGSTNPFQAFLSADKLQLYTKAISESDSTIQNEIQDLLLQGRSFELDCMKALVGIDHRVVTEISLDFSKKSGSNQQSSESPRPSSVLKAIAFTAERTHTDSASCSQLFISKELLFLCTITLFDDLRRMDDFVSEVRVACQAEQSGESALVTLLSGDKVQRRLSKSFASLPISQSELVWGALSQTPTQTPTSGAPSSSSRSMDKECQNVILRALIHATTVTSSSSVPSRRDEGVMSLEESYLSCDDILHLGAIISLSAPLPMTIVNAMTSLLREAAVILEELEAKGDSGINSTTNNAYVFNTVSLLLQLGSAAIVLHRNKQNSGSSDATASKDMWCEFRETVGRIGVMKCIQKPRPGPIDSTIKSDCLSAMAALLSLSAFVATCESLNVGDNRDVLSLTREVESVQACALTCELVDSCVSDMIVNSAETASLSCGSTISSSMIVKDVKGRNAKRTRKDMEIADPSISLPSTAAIDSLLMITRSVSTWCHLSISSEIICKLTTTSLRELSKCHLSGQSVLADYQLSLRHSCLCRLMQTASVLDCPILVNGFLAAVEQVLLECDTLLKVQRGDAISIIGGSHASFTALSFIIDSSGNTNSGLPLGLLLNASASALGKTRLSKPPVIALIAQHASSILSKLLLDLRGCVTSTDKSSKLKAVDKRAATGVISEETERALAATSSILLLCLRNVPSKKSVAVFANATTMALKKSGKSPLGDEDLETDIWDEVSMQLQNILPSLLGSFGVLMHATARPSISALAPLVLDFLLQRSIEDMNSSSDEVDRTHVRVAGSTGANRSTGVLHALSCAITRVFDDRERSTSDLKTSVELYRRVTSYYCALPSDLTCALDTTSAIKEITEKLVRKLMPYLQTAEITSQKASLLYDSSCFITADSLRLYAKFFEDETGPDGADRFLSSFSPPALPEILDGNQLYVELDGWFLLTGTTLLLQRRSGNLLSVKGSLVLIERIKAAMLSAASAASLNKDCSGSATDCTLMSLTVCLQGLVSSVPHTVSSEVGKMLVSLAHKCACQSHGTSDSAHPQTQSISYAALSRFVVLGVDSLLSTIGQSSGDGKSDSSLSSAIAVLENVAVSCTSSTHLLSNPSVALSVVSSLKRGITTIQQQQHKRGRRRLSRTDTIGMGDSHEQGEAENGNDESNSSQGKEHHLSVWASSCLSILSKIVARLVRGNGGIKCASDTVTSRDNSDRPRVEVSAHALSVLEQLFACDSVGGSSLPLLGNSIGSLGALLTTAIRVILSASESLSDDKRRSGVMSLNIANALRVAGRTLTAASSSRELNRHSHVLAASIVDLLAQRPLGSNTKELLLPGLFALFDRCKQRQRLQMFATVNAQTRAVLSDLHGTYLRDYKFTGQ